MRYGGYVSNGQGSVKTTTDYEYWVEIHILNGTDIETGRATKPQSIPCAQASAPKARPKTTSAQKEGFLTVTVPKGIAPGQSFLVTTEAGQMSVVCPPGVTTGMPVQIKAPPASIDSEIKDPASDNSCTTSVNETDEGVEAEAIPTRGSAAERLAELEKVSHLFSKDDIDKKRKEILESL